MLNVAKWGLFKNKLYIVYIYSHVFVFTTDFPSAAKLILFMLTTWHNVFSHSSVVCQAILTITRLKASEELLTCLTDYFDWEKV